MFNFIKSSLQKIYTGITCQLSALFCAKNIDSAHLQELEQILLSADTGVQTTKSIIEKLKEKVRTGSLIDGNQLKEQLALILHEILSLPALPHSSIFLLVGINGSGKTTLAAKLAHYYASQQKKVLLVAADTFRAAAVDQLSLWAQKINCPIARGSHTQDPASVVFQGCERFKKEHFDILIIDTAGRLQTKTPLMNELAKIKRVVSKQLPDQTITTLLTIDSMLGQNSYEQAKLFNESTHLDGVVLTKMDGTGRGGIIFSIANELQLPVFYITFGEQLDHIKEFDKATFIDNLLTS